MDTRCAPALDRWTAPEAGTNYAPLQGRLANYAVVPEDLLVPIRATMDPVAACTLPVAGLTAWFALVELAKVHAGQIVVVQRTGGVSMFALQFAVAHGATVIVVSSAQRKLDRAMPLGPSYGIDRGVTRDWDARVLEITSGRGADHVLEMGGGDLTRPLNATRVGGRISIIGLLKEREVRAPITSILPRRAELIGIGVGHRRALEDMVAAVNRLRIRPVVDVVYSFSQVPEAFSHMKRGALGKVVVQMDG